MLGPSLAIAVLAAVGIYVSAFMLFKQRRGERGGLSEPSVVMTARARTAGVSNALVGLLFYVGMLILTPLLSHPLAWVLAVAAALLASALSVYLAYSLLFVTRMPCAYCWTGHVVNWLLLALLVTRR
jgi:uncharacterized membrane protein